MSPFNLSSICNSELPWWLWWQRICLQCRRSGFDPWVRKIPWRREWQPSPVFLSGEFYGQRSLAGYSPWGCKGSDMTEWLILLYYFHVVHMTHSFFKCLFFHLAALGLSCSIWDRNLGLLRWEHGVLVSTTREVPHLRSWRTLSLVTEFWVDNILSLAF